MRRGNGQFMEREINRRRNGVRMNVGFDTTMRTLSILQPYAWLIAAGHKDIENRTWHSAYKGPLLIHAGKKYGPRIHAEYVEDMADMGITLPPFEAMLLGGVVGYARMTDCVKQHPSRWKMMGTHGFVLCDQRELPFVPWKGQLGFFDVPESAVALGSNVEWRGERSESRSHAGLAGSEQEGHDVRTPKL